jgi:hypothetical protein
MKKYSILSLSLLAASAIISAFFPTNASNEAGIILGNLQMSDNPSGVGDITCTSGWGGRCSYTVTAWFIGDSGSGTTAVYAFTTLGNTWSYTTIEWLD